MITCYRMAQVHLLDPVYDETHRGRLIAEGQVLILHLVLILVNINMYAYVTACFITAK